TYSFSSWLLASMSSLRFSSVTSGNRRSSDRIAVVITSATTVRVTHLLSAGTTYQGASSEDTHPGEVRADAQGDLRLDTHHLHPGVATEEVSNRRVELAGDRN